MHRTKGIKGCVAAVGRNSGDCQLSRILRTSVWVSAWLICRFGWVMGCHGLQCNKNIANCKYSIQPYPNKHVMYLQ